MSEEKANQYSLPTSAITNSSPSAYENWFEYPVRVYPHHTDYAGVVWHGTYMTWMEEARVEYLRTCGMNYADLVALGCDLLVVELSLRYHRSLRLGTTAILKTRMSELNGVRINFDYALESEDAKELYVTATVTLVAVDRERGKIMRQLPTSVKDALLKISNPMN
ncbi:MAG: acyl-CoA thioesterase [Calothrix sp. C42_A2020_038]|nr:acyl-CoA thioesterase [Calothrix sp. C42_A2020_038]